VTEHAGPPVFPPPTGYHYPPPPRTGPPGVVQAAAILTYVCTGLAMLTTLMFLAMAVLVGSVVAGDFQRSDLVHAGVYLTLSAIFSIGGGVLACWFAWQTTRRQGWARIGLTVLAALTVVLGGLTLSPPGLLAAAGAIAVLVLLFLPETNTWFREAPAHD
jgi:hypothetical protein